MTSQPDRGSSRRAIVGVYLVGVAAAVYSTYLSFGGGSEVFPEDRFISSIVLIGLVCIGIRYVVDARRR